MSKNTSRHLKIISIVLVTSILAVLVGRYPLTLAKIVAIVSGNHSDAMEQALFLNIRLPRVLFALVVGGFLALAGSIYQSLFRNPLVAPDVLGVSSGATIGAILAIVVLKQTFLEAQVLTFLFGIGAVLIAVGLSRYLPKHSYSLILSGIVVASLANSIIMMFKYMADPNRELVAIEYWMMGSLQNASWQRLVYMLSIGFVICFILYRLRYTLKIMTLGDDHAQSLGVSVKKARITAILLATVLVSLTIMNTGVVAWIGLIAPHIVRLLFKEDIEKNFISVLLVGGILLLVADTIARSLLVVEIPISIVTSLLGAIMLFILIVRGTYAN